MSDHDAKSAYQSLTSFVTQHGIRFEAHSIRERPDSVDFGSRHFRCVLHYGRKRMQVYFSQGSAWTEPPTAAEVLDCLVSDASSFDSAGGFDEWASELGFDPDSRKAEAQYQKVRIQSEQLLRLLGLELYSELLNNTERL